MTATKSKLLLIDGNSLMFRAFYALHAQLNNFVNQAGLHTNAIYTFKNMLDVLIDRFAPTNILVAFDAGKVTFRTKEYAEYKAGRAKTPPELSEQIPYIHELLKDYGITTYQLVNYEADDIIGTLAHEATQQAMPTVIVTGDRDLTQLASDNTTVAVTLKGVNDLELYTPAHIEEKYGITPHQIIDMKGLMGDTSDNYPGVTKVGEKTAIRLVKEYGSVEGVYDHLDEMKASKLKEHLIADQQQAFLSKKLATIDVNAPLTINLADTAYHGIHRDDLTDFYQRMEFKSFLDETAPKGEITTHEEVDIPYTKLTKDNLDEITKLTGPTAFIIEMLGDNYHNADFVGFVIGQKDHWFISRDVTLLQTPTLQQWLSDPQQEKWVFDAKRNYYGIHRLGTQLKGITFDLLLAAYLLNTNDNIDDVATVANSYGDKSVQTDEDIYGRGTKTAIPTDDKILYQHLAHKAAAIYHLHDSIIKHLQDHQQLSLFKNIELPLAFVLADMELAGITLDVDTLKQMGKNFSQSMAVIAEAIYREAGEEFNLNSTKQLGTILFEKMKLPHAKKTKTGYSTAEKVLDKLKYKYKIVADILDYRGIAKLQSTYVKGLLKTLQPDGKIHTRFLQTLTQTGRLSSVDPNMQNIPARDTGKQIRKAFVPSGSDSYLMSCDYSQIELRVLAHISGDKHMQSAFLHNEDIHAHTAMSIFGLKDPSQVTPDMRRKAKATNFGIVYGISDYGLSQNIGISRKEAHQFIQAYFEQYPQVKAYMDNIVKVARKQGYVETLFHRRRYLPDINATNYNLRSFAERTAMNTPIQGSAADIIKVAMLNVQKALKERHMRSRMLLQVHDELIFEIPKDEIDEMVKLIPELMDSAVKLDVPLKVETGYGKTWFDAK